MLPTASVTNGSNAPATKKRFEYKLVQLAIVLYISNTYLQGTTYPSYDVSKVLTASVGVNSADHDKGERKSNITVRVIALGSDGSRIRARVPAKNPGCGKIPAAKEFN